MRLSAVAVRPAAVPARFPILALLFGLAVGAVFAAVWLVLERAWTGKASLACGILLVSGFLAGIAAAGLAQRLARSSLSLRFAVILTCLLVLTAGLASFGLFILALATTPLPTDSLGHLLFFILTMGGGAAVAFLGLGAPLVIVPGLPLFVLFALLLARAAR